MKVIIVVAALWAAGAGVADAETFNFSYSTQSGVAARGTLAATNVGGFYSVDDVTGTRGGATITGYDFFDPTPQSFTFSGGQASNVDFSYYVGADDYEIRWPGNGGNFGTEFRTDAAGAVSSLLVTSFSLTRATAAAVPEPSSWALMLLGFAGAGTVLRRRRPTLASANAG